MSQQNLKRHGSQVLKPLATSVQPILDSTSEQSSTNSKNTGSTTTPKERPTNDTSRKTGTSLSSNGATTPLPSKKTTPQNYLTIGNQQNIEKQTARKMKNSMQSLVAETRFSEIKDLSPPELIIRLEKIDDSIYQLVNVQPTSEDKVAQSLKSLSYALNINLPEKETLQHLREVLMPYPSHILKVAFTHIRDTHKWPHFPRPADFLEAIKESTNADINLLAELQRRKSVVEMALKHKGIESV